ncbi:MAG TPA: tRNA (adenosine(37)-N6)-threonylcarbamoyltransferase complex dimerization subunit type 1 TsaB [Syntrophobacteraceae bacterium]|nr:tRNA (adenosine(37)-N6)-threonylcarbamoyltransferase complex dimerization subunit type 1 TsaB [Syntrophobacteraceae bacterium]
MKILAADTSTPSGSVAVMEGDRLLAEWTFHSGHTHNRRLLKTLDSVLRELGWSLDGVEAFAVTAGPGSFTGLRIGLTTIKTLAWSTGKPYVGISSLDVLAAPLAYSSHPVCAVLDAKKQQVYAALYRGNQRGEPLRASPYQVMGPGELPGRLTEPTILVGDGWLLYRDLFRQAMGESALEPPPAFHTLRAGFLADLAQRRLLCGEAQDPVSSVPLYVRPSEAELRLSPAPAPA